MQFYIIEKKPKGNDLLERYRTDFHYDDSVSKGSAPRCPKCGTFIGMLESLPPYRVHLETWGEEFGDLAFWMSDFLVTRRFRDAYQLSGLSGLSTFDPVEVLSHTSRGHVLGNPPEYFRVIPKIGSARVDIFASDILWGDNKLPTCERCLSGGGVLKRWSRVIIEKDTWNGDDVFYPFGILGTLVVSLRFFEWAENYHFHNLIMKPARECSHDFYPWEKG